MEKNLFKMIIENRIKTSEEVIANFEERLKNEKMFDSERENLCKRLDAEKAVLMELKSVLLEYKFIKEEN